MVYALLMLLLLWCGLRRPAHDGLHGLAVHIAESKGPNSQRAHKCLYKVGGRSPKPAGVFSRLGQGS